MSDNYLHNSSQEYTDEEIAKMGVEAQLEVMEIWFRDRFEDPAELTPFDSAEGGYIWIWGGPFDAREELEKRFADIVSDDTISRLAQELDAECPMWARIPKPEDYDDALIADLANITQHYHHFSAAILDIQALLDTEVADGHAPTLCKLLYVNVITAMETYLSDAFINRVVNSPKFMRRFVETFPAFKEEKVSLSEVYRSIANVEEKAARRLIELNWHHLHKVKPMYKETLDVEFPKKMEDIFRAIELRHDLVHRNGKTKAGELIFIIPKDVSELIRHVEAFVQVIDAQLPIEKDESHS